MIASKADQKGLHPTTLEVLNKRTFYIAQPLMRLSGYLIVALVSYLHFFFNALGASTLAVIPWLCVHLAFVFFLELSKKFMALQYDQTWFRLLRIIVNVISFTWLLIISQTADAILVFTFALPLIVAAVYFKDNYWILIATGVSVALGIYIGTGLLGGPKPFEIWQMGMAMAVLVAITLGTRWVYNSPPSKYGDLFELTHQLYESQDLYQLLQEMVQLCAQLVKAKYVLIFVIDPNTGQYIHHAHNGLILREGLIITGMIEKCIERIASQSIHADDLSWLDGDKKLYEAYFHCQPSSVLEVPFTSRQQKILGVICLIDQKSYSFDPATRSKIRRFSWLVGSAVENCLVYRTAKLSEARNSPICKRFDGVEEEQALAEVVMKEAISRLKKAEDVVLHRYEPSTEQLHPKITSDKGELQPWKATYIENERLGKSKMRWKIGIAGMALALGEPVLVRDVREHPWFIQSAQSIEFRSLLSAPLIDPSNNTAYGTISLHHSDANVFTLVDEIELVTLATQTARKLTAIAQYQSWRKAGGQFKKIFDEVRLFNIQAGEAALCQQIVDAVVKVLPFSIARLRLLDEHSNQLVNKAASRKDGREWAKQNIIPIPLKALEPFMTEEFRVARAYLIPGENDAWRKTADIYMHIPEELVGKKAGWQAHDALLVPLLSQKDRLMGLLTLDLPDDGKKPSMDILEEVSIIGGAVAWTIDLAQAHQRVDISQQRTKELIKSISEKLARSQDIHAIGEVAVQVGANIFRAEGCSFHLVDVDKKNIELKNSNYLEETKQINRKKQISTREKCGLTAFVASTGKELFFPDESYRTHIAWAGDSDHLDYLNSHEVKSLILMPILDRNSEILGVLSLENKITDWGYIGAFDQEDCQDVRLFATELGRAIELIQRYEAIEKWQQDGVEDDLHELINWYRNGVVAEIEYLNDLLLTDDIESAKPQTKLILNRAHTVSVEIKTLHTSMHRKYMERENLKIALEEMVDSWKVLFTERNQEFNICVDCPEQLHLPDIVKNTLLRIASHALTNCIKHSGIQENPDVHVHILVDARFPDVVLKISDNGKGMDCLARGYGIQRMEQLVQKLNQKKIPASLEFLYQGVQGVTVIVKIVLEKEFV